LELLAIILFALVTGGVLGTLVNVVATRLPSDQEIIGPPLHSATGEASFRQLVPYLGARLVDGTIDWPNLSTQLGAGLLAAIALILHGFTFSALETTVLSMVLLTILRIDWQHHSIYVITIWPGMLLALLFSLVHSPSHLLSASVAGALAAFVFLLLFFLAIAIYRKRALGFGDVLLAGLIGTMVGLQWVTHAILLGMILAALGGIFLVLIKVKSRTDYIPYGAYLSLGALVVVLATG
jgi:leader peptidase (prepilin peptidase) / N-methyltransferase